MRYSLLDGRAHHIHACAGKTPRTRDFVNFFLLENQKGYCVHYATAGTILARHLGIPARYCEGYLVGEDILDSASVDSDGYRGTKRPAGARLVRVLCGRLRLGPL
ncbi:MAG: transglutaminase-like domain-containing protein [Ruminococcus sp.]